MNDLTVWAAQYLLWVMVAVFAAIWLWAETRRGKVTLAAAGVIGLVITVILIMVAGALHTDPRPFVQNPSIHPLFAHAPDNGFPSDHSAAAALIAVLIAIRHRWYGAGLGLLAIVIAWARVAAHVHHTQDVVAGLAIGVVAAALAYAAAQIISGWLMRHPTALLARIARVEPAPAVHAGPAGDAGRHSKN